MRRPASPLKRSRSLQGQPNGALEPLGLQGSRPKHCCIPGIRGNGLLAGCIPTAPGVDFGPDQVTGRHMSNPNIQLTLPLRSASVLCPTSSAGAQEEQPAKARSAGRGPSPGWIVRAWHAPSRALLLPKFTCRKLRCQIGAPHRPVGMHHLVRLSKVAPESAGGPCIWLLQRLA